MPCEDRIDGHVLTGIRPISPFVLRRTTPAPADRAMREVLCDRIDRLHREAGAEFPRKVTAFRDGMSVHGRYRQPCAGRVLADRSLSRLLKANWSKSVEELESKG